MKIIPMYLPQFHRLPENDAWWGEGFTEWTAVKAAEPLYERHVQPKVPLNEYYYDLLDKETMTWQADLMAKYHVGGMCFYHYWFKDGRRILEKPAENLLKWTDIDMPFCFSWANEAWSRTWSSINWKNVWSSKFEPERKENDTGILLEQNYGGEKEWKEHFDYLLPFFQDRRYIKVENKPVFLFYRSASIPCLNRMIECWRRWAKESGFADLYLLGANITEKNSLDALLLHEPQYTMTQCFDQKYSNAQGINVARYIEGGEIWKHILARQVSEKVYYGGFSGYDDTPRRGSGGFIMTKPAPQEFALYLKQLMKKNSLEGNELVFINAWNEWGEGMYLEPDEEYGYAYLEAVKHAAEHWQEVELAEQEEASDELKKANSVIHRYQCYWRVLNSWLILKEEHKSVVSYFTSHGYTEVALYGIGMIGTHLVKELEGGPVKLKYGIDQQGAENIHQSFPVYRREDNLPEADIIVVSVTHDYTNIYNLLKEKVSCPIISLEEIVEESRSL